MKPNQMGQMPPSAMAMCRKCALFGRSTGRLSAAWNRLPNKSSRCVSQSFSSKPVA